MSKHTAFIDRWVEFMKTHPYEEWKSIQNEFIDAQYDLHTKVMKDSVLKEKFLRK